MGGIVVRPRARIFHGHDWVYSSEVQKAFGDPQPGEVITLKDFKDRPLGTAIYNPESQIVARRISRRKQQLNRDFFERRLERAALYRESQKLGNGPQRLVWSEADGLPGVVIDRYGDAIVLQTLTLGMDMAKDELVAALVDRYSPAVIVERNDSPIRKAEGLELVTGILHGDAASAIVEIENDGIKQTVDLLSGQKTGVYLDQFDAYAAVAKRAEGKSVLDTFCNQGGFALHCAKQGATSVLGIDVSDVAIASAKENAIANDLDPEKIEFRAANVFDFLKKSVTSEKPEKYDLIVLDPPSFTRNRKGVNDAMRGYKEIHLRALKLLNPDGILATFCCSHHVSASEYMDMIRSASVDAKRTVRVLETHTQRADHPVIATIPETEYLKGFTLQAVASF